MSALEVKVPDIGDFKDVPVIEVLVKPGDRVNAEDSLVTLESEKATMDVPAPAAGVVRDLKVKIGDKVSEGSMLLTLDTPAEGKGGANASAGAGGANASAGADAGTNAAGAAAGKPPGKQSTSPSAAAQPQAVPVPAP